MGLYRSPTGAIEAIDDDKAGAAIAGGYVPITSAQAGAPVEREDRGVLGTINAGATSLLSGATLGLSDVALRGLLNRGQFERLAAEREANPIASGIGQVAGTILPALAAPESILGRAPSGLLSRATAPLIERGGVSALVGSGLEGAAQNAGAYLSDVALGNRDLSAEGIAGAVGGGFGFGVGGGVVAMGIEKGTMVARRMFARIADGGERAANEAEQAWLTQYQSTIEAHDAAVDAAKAQLAAARAAREDAALARDRASALTAETRINAPQIDAERAAAQEIDAQMSAELAAKQAAIKASELPVVKVGNIDDLERLIFGQQEAKSELDDLLRQIETPDIGGTPVEPMRVPIGEFGAPGARGIKTPEEIERAAVAAGTDGTGIAPSLEATGAARPMAKREIPDYTAIKAHEAKTDSALDQTVPARAIADRGYYELPGHGEDAVRVAKAKQAIAEGQREPIDLNVSPNGKITVTGGRHRLAAAIEADAPIKVRWSTGFEPAPSDVARYGSGHMAIIRDSEAIIKSDPKIANAIEDFRPVVAKENLTSKECTNGLCDTIEPKFRQFSKLKLNSHRFDLSSDDGMAEVKKLYRMTDKEVAEVKAENLYRMKELDVPKEDMFHQVSITPDGTVIDWTANQFHDLPVPYVFRLHPQESDLEALLRGTSERVASGESLKSIGAPAVAEYASAKAAKSQAFRERAAFKERAGIGSARRDYKVKQLEIAHDAAIDRVATATDPVERAAATAEANAIEQQLTAVGRPRSAPDDIARLAPAIEKYERKSADLTEALGEAAPPAAREHAAAFRAAEDDADRKMTDRAARAVDDSVHPPTDKGTIMNPQDFERVFGKPMPLPPTSAEALAAAKQNQMAASAAYKRAMATETEAKIGARRATEARKAIPESPRATPPMPRQPSTLGSIATAIGVAGELGVPGIPKPDDIPVIGPLLGAYIKYRAIKATAGRFVGLVTATGDTRAAALAARTKDKIATAVDRTLGLAEKAAPKARSGIVAANAVIGKRIFDDGEPDAPKDASRPEQAAVRIREILAANQRPELITAMVRHEMRGVTDPDLVAAAEKHLIARFAHLASVVPKPPPDNAYAQRPWAPSMAATHELEQRLAVIHDPVHALSGPVSPAAADTFRQVHPQLYQLAKDRLIERVGDLTDPMPRADRLRASALFQIPIDISLDPSHIAITRAPSKPDTMPTMANVPDLGSMYNPQNTRIKQ